MNYENTENVDSSKNEMYVFVSARVINIITTCQAHDAYGKSLLDTTKSAK